MAKHKEIWLTEQELGDLIWSKWETFFPDLDIYKDFAKFREFKIGFGRVDFATFSKQEAGNHVELFELKITSSISSLIQLIKYKQDLEEYLRLTFYTGSVSDEMTACCPKIELHIIARYFDNQTIEMCSELGISLWRVTVNSRIEIDVELMGPDCFPKVSNSPEFSKSLLDFFAKDLVK